MNLDEEPGEVALTFREQQDGKRVAFLAGGKCVIVGREWVNLVSHGERWRVRLIHKETFAIAQPLERVEAGDPNGGATALPAGSATSLKGGGVTTILVEPRGARATAGPPRQGPTKIQGMTVEPDNVIRRGERVALFVDAANMDFASRDLGFFMDWQKSLDYFLADGHFSDAYYYIAEYGDDPQKDFLDDLAHKGFIIRSKPVKVLTDEDGKRNYKGNIDVEIALDMVAAADNYDVAYLFSGDSDFKRVVEVLQSRGKRVYVVSSRKSLSRELGYIASKPVFFIEDFREILARHD